MSYRIRASRRADLPALYEMAKLAGSGFTNLPPDRGALRARLDRSAEAFASDVDALSDQLYMLMLEDTATGRVVGTSQIMAKVGERWPFYSYRRGMLNKWSAELGRNFRAETLTLCTDLEGASEVGGLFLHPRVRAGGLGALLARSRYLFIRQHRARFADRMLAELRGVIDEAGNAPFWDGLGARFFGMSFQEADEFNAINGNQFIADLMPKHPIYTAILPDAARAVIGLPHPSGRPAMRMLEAEGFVFDGFIDIFDGGPTMVAATDGLLSIRGARSVRFAGTGGGSEQAIVARGRLAAFVAAFATVAVEGETIRMSQADADVLGAAVGDELVHLAR